jgi:hypothetical protein
MKKWQKVEALMVDKGISTSTSALLIPQEEAVNIIKDCLEKGYVIEKNIEDYRTETWNSPSDKKIIDKLKKSLSQWIDYVSDHLVEIYSNHAYVHRFNPEKLDDEWYSLTPQKLKNKMIKNSEGDIRYIYRLRDLVNLSDQKAKQKKEREIRREIIKGIGEMESHWNFEKKHMVNDLKINIEKKTEYLEDRLAYLEVFGGDSRTIEIEFLRIDAVQRLIGSLPEETVELDPMPKVKGALNQTDKKWESLFNKITEEGKDFETAKMEYRREILLSPRYYTMTIYSDLLTDNDFLVISAGKGNLSTSPPAFAGPPLSGAGEGPGVRFFYAASGTHSRRAIAVRKGFLTAPKNETGRCPVSTGFDWMTVRVAPVKFRI